MSVSVRTWWLYTVVLMFPACTCIVCVGLVCVIRALDVIEWWSVIKACSRCHFKPLTYTQTHIHTRCKGSSITWYRLGFSPTSELGLMFPISLKWACLLPSFSLCMYEHVDSRAGININVFFHLPSWENRSGFYLPKVSFHLPIYKMVLFISCYQTTET